MTSVTIPTIPGSGAAQRYEMLGEIARGRMGVVYRLIDHTLGREVAYKIPVENYFADTKSDRRFVNEVQITAQLQHPGVPAVHEIGSLADGRPFMIMKLIKGHTLDTLLKERPDPTADIERFLAVFELVCQTMAYAHARGVVHRDLEPANIMIDAFGVVQVLDWGLALMLAEKRPESVVAEDARLGAIFGNPAYMAPEQA